MEWGASGGPGAYRLLMWKVELGTHSRKHDTNYEEDASTSGGIVHSQKDIFNA